MATLVLGAVGTAAGGAIGGSVLGVSAATIGGFVGSSAGSFLDSSIISMLQPGQRVEGQRLENLQVTTAVEGTVIPRPMGRYRVGGNIIWATDFREEVTEDTQGGGKGGGGPKVTTVTYRYYASFAVALGEGVIPNIGRIWADGKPMDLQAVTWRYYPGSETQNADPFIAARMGADSTPAYRGVAYLVFEDLLLEKYGNRLPQISVEVIRPIAEDDTLEGQLRAITMIPGSGEYVYSTEVVKASGVAGNGESVHAQVGRADILESLDLLFASAPNLESASLVVSWFGNDLRCGQCEVKPGIETADKSTNVPWSVNGVPRASAYVVSQDGDGRPVYGGTPTDTSVVQAIQEMKARGLRVTFYPFLLMDVPSGNALPDPYSDNAATSGQPAFPWRGRITCSPAAGYTGTVDQTATAATQVDAFFGAAAVGDFSVSGETVSWTGGADWGFRRMILHYAHLCTAAGGVDAFIIGSEMRGLTGVRSDASTFPAVAELVALAGDVRSILGSGPQISYAADWSEYFGHQPADGSGDVYFHLDPLWADADIDFIGIDNYMPVSDWRDGFDHIDAQSWRSIYERAYLQANIEGGEGFDWYYASDADRIAQVRTPITDGTGKPWVFRYKDLRSWWSEQHFNRPGGTESGSPTDWVPESKPIRFTEFGSPAVDRGPNQPNVFVDPKSSESQAPYFSRGWRDDAAQRAHLEAVLGYWGDLANNPASSSYAGRMIDMSEAAAWTWDARPYPFFPAREDAWSDGENWRLGHWLTGRLGSLSLPGLVRHLCERAGMPASQIDVSGLWGAVEGLSSATIDSPRAQIDMLARHFGFDATESGGMIVFTMRGAAPTVTVTIDDLVDGGDSGEPLQLERAQETELPQILKWAFGREDEEYDPTQVEARRSIAASTRVQSESFPMAIPPEEGERRCRRALQEAWGGRETTSFSLPPSRMALDACNVVSISHDGRTYDFQIMSLADADSRRIEGVRRDRLAYDLPPGAPRDKPVLPTPTIFGELDIRFMDLPQLPSQQPAHRPFIGIYTAPWPGEISVRQSPDISSFDGLTEVTTPGVYGETLDSLGSGPLDVWDDANTVTVQLESGSLQSVTDIELLSGANAFAIETAPGEYEIVQAANAALVATNTYELSRLLRGQRGTEAQMVGNLPAGAAVIKLDTIAALPLTPTDVGIEYNYAFQGGNLPGYFDILGVASGTSIEFTATGRGLQPFSPCNVRQPYLTERTPGDLEITWIRRSRSLEADSWEIAEVPLAEEPVSGISAAVLEAYQVDIMDGSTVLRTLSTDAPAVTYTSAEQIADFGAEMAPGDTLEVRIYQLSQTYGRGAPLIETLKF